VKLLRVFNLDEKKHLRPSAVSASDCKAAVILRSLILNPQLLILDNPTQGLSTEHIPKLIELLQESESKHDLRYMIISSEDRNLLERLPGRVFNVTHHGSEKGWESRRKIA
jgi:ABC-type molybdenum transport system ATPase subunit/photorepair protein PhrA